jgi:hypothetical protein
MAAIHIEFEYDPAENILFTVDDGDIATEDDAVAFLAQYEEQFQKIGHPVYLVSSIDNLRVKPAAAEFYGRRLKELAQRHVLGFSRYSGNPTARMTVRTASLRSDYVINIYDTKEQAVGSVRKMKAGAQQPPA